MSNDGKIRDSGPHKAESAIADFRATTERAISEWSDLKLDAVIARLRRDSAHKPENIAILMFLEDARLRRHQLRMHPDGKGDLRKEAPPPDSGST